jgi:hypothetical protein
MVSIWKFLLIKEITVKSSKLSIFLGHSLKPNASLYHVLVMLSKLRGSKKAEKLIKLKKLEKNNRKN